MHLFQRLFSPTKPSIPDSNCTPATHTEDSITFGTRPTPHDSSTSSSSNHLNAIRSKLRQQTLEQKFTLSRAEALAHNTFQSNFNDLHNIIRQLTNQLTLVSNKLEQHLLNCECKRTPTSPVSSTIHSNLFLDSPVRITSTSSSNISFRSNQPRATYLPNIQLKQQTREQIYRDLPPNSCAITCSLDSLAKSKWIHNTQSLIDPDHPIAKYLNNRKDCEIGKITQLIFQQPLNQNLQQINQAQDPWIVLCNLQNWILNSSNTETALRLPVLTCPCGSNQQNIELKNTKACRTCENCNQPKTISTLPQEFYVRMPKPSLVSTFAFKPNPPKFEHHFVTAAIQFNPINEHFRYVRFYNKNSSTIYDGSLMLAESDQNCKFRILNDVKWHNYILTFTAGNQYQIPTSTTDRRPVHITTLLTGGHFSPTQCHQNYSTITNRIGTQYLKHNQLNKSFYFESESDQQQDILYSEFLPQYVDTETESDHNFENSLRYDSMPSDPTHDFSQLTNPTFTGIKTAQTSNTPFFHQPYQIDSSQPPDKHQFPNNPFSGPFHPDYIKESPLNTKNEQPPTMQPHNLMEILSFTLIIIRHSLTHILQAISSIPLIYNTYIIPPKKMEHPDYSQQPSKPQAKEANNNPHTDEHSSNSASLTYPHAKLQEIFFEVTPPTIRPPNNLTEAHENIHQPQQSFFPSTRQRTRKSSQLTLNRCFPKSQNMIPYPDQSEPDIKPHSKPTTDVNFSLLPILNLSSPGKSQSYPTIIDPEPMDLNIQQIGAHARRHVLYNFDQSYSNFQSCFDALSFSGYSQYTRPHSKNSPGYDFFFDLLRGKTIPYSFLVQHWLDQCKSRRIHTHNTPETIKPLTIIELVLQFAQYYRRINPTLLYPSFTCYNCQNEQYYFQNLQIHVKHRKSQLRPDISHTGPACPNCSNPLNLESLPQLLLIQMTSQNGKPPLLHNSTHKPTFAIQRNTVTGQYRTIKYIFSSNNEQIAGIRLFQKTEAVFISTDHMETLVFVLEDHNWNIILTGMRKTNFSATLESKIKPHPAACVIPEYSDISSKHSLKQFDYDYLNKQPPYKLKQTQTQQKYQAFFQLSQSLFNNKQHSQNQQLWPNNLTGRYTNLSGNINLSYYQPLPSCSLVSSALALNIHIPADIQNLLLNKSLNTCHHPDFPLLTDAWISIQIVAQQFNLNTLFYDHNNNLYNSPIAILPDSPVILIQRLTTEEAPNHTPNSKYITFNRTTLHFSASSSINWDPPLIPYLRIRTLIKHTPPSTIGYNTRGLLFGGKTKKLNQRLNQRTNQISRYRNSDIRNFIRPTTPPTENLQRLTQPQSTNPRPDASPTSLQRRPIQRTPSIAPPPIHNNTTHALPSTHLTHPNPGNSRNLTIFSWNIRGYKNQKSWRAKQKIIQSQNPAVASINQTFTGKLLIKNFITLQATPVATTSTSDRSPKQNACLLIHQSIKHQLLSRGRNYISTIVRSTPFLRATLVVSLYLYPHADDYHNNIDSQTLDYLMNDIIYTQNSNINDFIIAGDFNMTPEELARHQHPAIKRITTLYTFSPNENIIRHNGQRIIDFIFTNLPDCTQIHMNIPDLPLFSDHYPISINTPAKQPEPLGKIPNKKFDFKLTKTLLQQQDINKLDPDNLQTTISQTFHSSKISGQKPRITVNHPAQSLLRKSEKLLQITGNPNLLENLQKQLDIYLEEIERDRFSPASSIAFKKIKKLTNYHLFGKREGSIMHEAKMNDQIISGDRLQSQLSSYFHMIHNLTPDQDIPIEFPKLNTSDQTIRQMARNIKAIKASAYDCIHETAFSLCSYKTNCPGRCQKCKNKWQLLQTITNRRYWNNSTINRHLNCRLIALNKCHPQTPQINEHRPIVICNPIVKFLQGYFLPELSSYLKNKMNKMQFGFVPGRNIDQCKQLLIGKLHSKIAAGQQPICLFVDFSSAYDRVNRKQLYDTIRKNKILQPQSLNLLRFIHKNITVQIGKNKVSTTTGVPQGLTSSPACFDIITQGLLDNLLKSGCYPIMYADDLALICDNTQNLAQGIRLIDQWTKESNMNINPKKSGILPFNGANIPSSMDTLNIPVIHKYKYLGYHLNQRLDNKDHLSETSTKLNYICSRLTPIRNRNNIKMNLNFFKLFAMPVYSLAFAGWEFQPKRNQDATIRQIRTSAKKFLNIPKNTSSKLVEMITGNLENKILKTTIRIRNSLTPWRTPQDPGPTQIQFQPQNLIKNTPNFLTSLIGQMYGSQCPIPGHNKHILNNEHLINSHNLPDIYTSLADYQTRSNTTAVQNFRLIQQEVQTLIRKSSP